MSTGQHGTMVGSNRAAELVSSKMKPVACRKCHARKVKCPGGHPCNNCVQMSCEAECIYPKRDRQIKISQSYIESLMRENQELRNHNRQIRIGASAAQEPTDDTEGLEPRPDIASPSEPSRNPVLDEKPWFLSIRSSEIPILIGEVADAAFATRFRQLLTDQAINHTLRTSYPSNDQIMELAQANCPFPSPAHARFLTRVALKNLEGSFHISRHSLVGQLLEQYLLAPHTFDPLPRCKLMALFALGELYSSSCQTQDTTTPGLAFFSYASKSYDLLHERPSVDIVEVSLLLSLYALCVNRRHSAYSLASSAVRNCVVMGLHLNLPESQINDPATKEHLIRIWWTAYIMDHITASISSQIVSIPDDEIFADLPSSITGVTGASQDDFQHAELLIARIQLARTTRSMIKSVYGRAQEAKSFLQRVQHALQDLKQWLQKLPAEMQMDSGSSHSKPFVIQSLHLAFNQSVILATRPVLLHMLRMHKESKVDTPATTERIISKNVETLAEACIRCARHSYATVVESWIEGSFKTFDYFNTRYLFSAATILAISSLLGGAGSSENRENFCFASQLIEKLRDSGSFSATEFCRHLEAMKDDIQGFLARAPSSPDNEAETASAAPESPDLLDNTVRPSQFMTSGMALAEPSLEAFLQNEQDVPHIDFLLDNTQIGGLYWPISDQ